MNNKLQAKDLINVGIFTAIYFVVFFVCGMLGYVPILFILVPAYFPIITGIPFMLFLTKVKTFGMVTIMSILCGILMFATGHSWVPVVTACVCGVLADLVFKAGDYRSLKHTVIGYGIFSIWPIGAALPMWLMRDSYFEYIRSSMGDEYANALLSLTPNWIPYAFVAVAFIAGIIGAYVGKAILKKHFRKAGIA